MTKTRGAIGYVNARAAVDWGKNPPHRGRRPPVQRTLLIRVEPEYPETLKRLLIGGTVRLAVTVAPNGTVENVKQLGGNPALVEAAIVAVKQWVYAPANSRTKLQVAIPFDPH